MRGWLSSSACRTTSPGPREPPVCLEQGHALDGATLVSRKLTSVATQPASASVARAAPTSTRRRAVLEVDVEPTQGLAIAVLGAAPQCAMKRGNIPHALFRPCARLVLADASADHLLHQRMQGQARAVLAQQGLSDSAPARQRADATERAASDAQPPRKTARATRASRSAAVSSCQTARRRPRAGMARRPAGIDGAQQVGAVRDLGGDRFAREQRVQAAAISRRAAGRRRGEISTIAADSVAAASVGLTAGPPG